MANYMEYARSNYFRVREDKLPDFEDWCMSLDLDYFTKTIGEKIYYMITPNQYANDFGGWPGWKYDEENDEQVDIDVAHDLSQFLEEDSIAILQSVGYEKLRYLTGVSIAVNDHGVIDTVSIDDIYGKMQSYFPTMETTQAVY